MELPSASHILTGSFHICAVAACVGTRDDEELAELFDNAECFDLSFFSNNTVAEFVKHFISTGTLHDARVLQMRLKRLLGNATFLQAFQHSGKPPVRREHNPRQQLQPNSACELHMIPLLLLQAAHHSCWPREESFRGHRFCQSRQFCKELVA